MGLKELPDNDIPLPHEYIHFQHIFKLQQGWAPSLSRFLRGGGVLYDLEFLADPSTGRRVAAFGYHAGYAGAALALLVWAHQLQRPDTPFPSIGSYPDEDRLISDVRQQLDRNQTSNKIAGSAQSPRVIVIGALGRCGKGAVDLCRAVGIPEENILKWDLDETKAGGPFQEIADSDIFVNCIYMTTPIPPFITPKMLSKPGRQLSVVCDVSCDPNNEHNPVPIYTEWSTFAEPTLRVQIDNDQNKGPLSVISIDHLPSLLPREASEAFSGALLPHLLTLDKREMDGVWIGAKRLFDEKVASLPPEYQQDAR